MKISKNLRKQRFTRGVNFITQASAEIEIIVSFNTPRIFARNILKLESVTVSEPVLTDTQENVVTLVEIKTVSMEIVVLTFTVKS